VARPKSERGSPARRSRVALGSVKKSVFLRHARSIRTASPASASRSPPGGVIVARGQLRFLRHRGGERPVSPWRPPTSTPWHSLMPAQRSRATCCSPRLRYWTLADLLPELTGPLFAQLQRVSAAIAAPGTDGGCAVINNTAIQNVPHLHVHVIPRTHRDGLPRTVTMLAYARGHLLLAPHQVGRRGRAGKLHMSAQRDPHPVYLRSPAERGPAGSRR
jgi:hypothetical protein